MVGQPQIHGGNFELISHVTSLIPFKDSKVKIRDHSALGTIHILRKAYGLWVGGWVIHKILELYSYSAVCGFDTVQKDVYNISMNSF